MTVYSGLDCIGFIVDTGDGFDAVTEPDGEHVGTFKRAKDAARAITAARACANA